MEALYLLVAGILLYVISDWILDRIEIGVGRRLKQRSVIFFAILLVLAVTSFSLIQFFIGAG
jgi:hypothetical protein